MTQTASTILKGRKAYGPALFWAGLILILSAIPGSSFDKFDWSDILNLDKIAHFIVYAILTTLLGFGMIVNHQNKAILKSFGMATVYGALMEFMQYACFTGRYFEILDLIANIIGSIAGSLICYCLIKK